MSDSEEDDEEWDKPVESSMCESPLVHAGGEQVNPDLRHGVDGQDHSRVILHIDIDCFYAQVEMIRNPTLRNKPLGIQQKYIVVTCNYPARERGVTKLMRITDAREKCPELVLVSGEDLTNYRDMSYKISNYLQKYCPLVERLGFDENFLDITDLVKDRLNSGSYEKEVKGYVYKEEEVKDSFGSGCHERLLVGSQVAADIREGLHSELGITSCGGVAVNKLLSKLVAGKHKPNCQTTLFPEQIGSLLAELTSVRQIPGIGSTTARRLKEIGIESVQDLQNAAKLALEEEFGTQAAENMKNWCFGIDKSPVIAFGLPQTLSDEDSFAAKKCSTIPEVKKKFKQLISSLLERLLHDGRTPRTFRLTVRKVTSDNTYLNKESRQCPLPSSLFQKYCKDNLPFVCNQLETYAYDLFTKMVDVKRPFFISLINVAFTKMEQVASKNSITAFFSPKKSKTLTSCEDQHRTCNDSVKGGSSENNNDDTDNLEKKTSPRYMNSNNCINQQSDEPSHGTKDGIKAKGGLLKWFNKSGSMKAEIDKEKDNIRRTNVSGETYGLKRKAEDVLGVNNSKQLKHDNITDTQQASNHHKKCKETESNFPSDIDENVFKELPPDIQTEILRHQKTVLQHTRNKDAGCSGSRQSESRNSVNLFSSVRVKNSTDDHPSAQRPTTFSGEKSKGMNNVLSSSKSLNLNSSETSSNPIDRLSTTHTNDAGKSCTQSSSCDVDTPDIPAGMDRSVFEALPADIQKEVMEDWKQKLKSNIGDSNKQGSVLCVKSPKSSSGVNIMSFFPKSNKKK